VQHVLHAVCRARGERFLREVALEEFRAADAGEVGALAGDQAVRDANAMSAAQQFFREVRADEPGAAGDEIVGHYDENRPCGRPGMTFIAF
jgi:hypothetical protein